jgi:hypothetical protein
MEGRGAMRTPMRLRFSLLIAVSLLAVASAPLPMSVAATTNGGDFIVKCLATANVAAVDPIVAPGVSETSHYHLFSGNTITPTGNLTNNAVEGHAGTTCRDTKDTSLIWTPDFWRCAWNGYGNAPKFCNELKTDTLVPTTDFRVYYIADDGQQQMNFLPDGTVFVQGNSATQNADGTSNGSTFPNTILQSGSGTEISDFDCGAGGGAPTTPQSPWPYNCNLVAPYCGAAQGNCGFDTKPAPCGTTITCVKVTYAGKNWWYQKGYCAPTAFVCTSGNNANVTLDGMVERIFMPDCWNGSKSATVNGDHLPGFIPDQFTAAPVRDFKYQSSDGVCPAGYFQVPQVSPRMHWFISNPLAGSLSTKNVVSGGTGDPGLPKCGNPQDDQGAPCAQVGDQFAPPHVADFSIWLGPMTGVGMAGCPNRATPPTPLANGAGGSACLMGLNAQHTDYWNTWQQPEGCDALAPQLNGNVESYNNCASGAGASVEDRSTSATRNLDDLTEDCLNAVAGSEPMDNQTCGFVSNLSGSTDNLDGR